VDILSSVKKVKTGKYICNTKWGDCFVWDFSNFQIV
jgi:hypothetical protein